MDALRLSLGTLTVLPVPAPSCVDRRVASRAMTLAPLVGGLLAVLAAVAVWLLPEEAPLVTSVLVIALLALLTRGLHLDGLADTADGLGSGRPAVEALEVMRRSDIGPFGVATLVLTLLVQVAALSHLLTQGRGGTGVAVSLVASRAALPLVCRRWVPAARRDGLGRGVASSVGGVQLMVAAGGTLLLVGLALVAGTALDGLSGVGRSPTEPASPARDLLGATAAVLAALAAAWGLERRCVRRLGGMTGDVMGACVETAFTTALVVLTLAASR
jgi:adenosylcobinamide-GDP ribazoletransferase